MLAVYFERNSRHNFKNEPKEVFTQQRRDPTYIDLILM